MDTNKEIPVILYGPAGSGKTYTARNMVKAIGKIPLEANINENSNLRNLNPSKCLIMEEFSGFEDIVTFHHIISKAWHNKMFYTTQADLKGIETNEFNLIECKF